MFLRGLSDTWVGVWWRSGGTLYERTLVEEYVMRPYLVKNMFEKISKETLRVKICILFKSIF